MFPTIKKTEIFDLNKLSQLKHVLVVNSETSNRPQGVNFINVKRTNFSYESCSSYMYVVKAAKKTFVPKTHAFNVDEIEGRTY